MRVSGAVYAAGDGYSTEASCGRGSLRWGGRGTYAGRREDAEEEESEGKSSHGVRPETIPSIKFNKLGFFLETNFVK